MHHRGRLVGIAIIVAVLVGEPPVVAQTKSAPPVDEIIVRAQKRDENLLEVPVAINVLDQDLLESEFITSFDQLPRLAPSLTLLDDDLRIRGVGTGGFAVQVEPSVAVAIDGVVLGRTSQALLDLADVERIEVLRGPQGTLFGKNASAGLVQVITKRPAKDYEADLEFQGEEQNEYVIRGTVSGPVTSTSGLRLSGIYRNDAGYTPNPSVAGDRNGVESYTTRAKYEWDVTEDLNLLVTGFVRDNELDGPELVFREVQDPALRTLLRRVGVRPSAENEVASSDGRGFENRFEWGTWAEANWTTFGDHVLTSLTAYLDYEQDVRDDVDEQPVPLRSPIFFRNVPTAFGTVGPGNVQQLNNQEIRQFSQEFRLTSPPSRTFEYIAGLYGQYFELDDVLRRDFDSCLSVAALLGLANPDAPPPGPVSPPLRFGDRCVDPTGQVISLSEASPIIQQFFGLPRTIRGVPGATIAEVKRSLESENYAVFGQGTYHLTDRVDVVAGARVQYDEISGGVDISVPNGIPGFGFGLGPGLSGASVDGVGASGKAALQYHLTDDAMAYVSYARGYKGPTGTFEGGEFASLDPEESNNYEIGLKTAVLDRRGYVSLTGFWSDYDNFQEEEFSDIEKSFILSNVGSVRTRGVELESRVEPLEGLTFDASGAYVDAKVVEFPDGRCFAPETLDPGCTITRLPPGSIPPTRATKDLAGAELPNSPDWKLYVRARYQRDIPSTPLLGFLQMSYSWQDDVQFSLDQNPRTIQDAYGILDGSIGLGDRDGRVLVSFFVQNITDQNYASVIFQDFVTGFSPNIIQFRPKEADRTFGFAIRVRL